MRPLRMTPFSHSKSIEALLLKRNDQNMLQSCGGFFQQLDKKRNETVLNLNETCKIIDT
jgi:hypothetical protein